MAYRHLVKIGYLLMEVAQVVQIEVVAGIEAQSTLVRHPCRLDKGGNGTLTVGGIATGVTLGVEFHSVGSRGGGMLYHVWIGIDEDRDPYATRFELGHDVLQKRLMVDGIPAGIAGEYILGIGHQGHLCGTDGLDQLGKTTYRITFDIELFSKHRL